MGLLPKGWGDYPPEYNREIHGPYNPSIYYGKRDTPFGDVKLGELGSWLARRNKSPRAMAQAISRAWFRYYINWMTPKRSGPAFIYQYLAVFIFANFLLSYDKSIKERKYRYH